MTTYTPCEYNENQHVKRHDETLKWVIYNTVNENAIRKHQCHQIKGDRHTNAESQNQS